MEDLGIYGNQFSFKDLYRWIDDRVNRNYTKMDQNACIVLIGAPGIGKTYSIEKICKSLDIHIKKMDSTNCKTIKEFSDIFIKMASTNLEEILQQQIRKKIIFIDEFEIMIQLDRNIPSLLYQLIDTATSGNRSLPYIPIIIACNGNVEKKLGDIKRFCKIIYLKSPSDTDILLMLRAYTKKNNISIETNRLLNISESVSGNIQYAFNMLEYELLKNNSCKTMISHEAIDIMPDINILYKNPSHKIAYQLFEEDIWMNPLRFHENLPIELDMRKGTKEKKDRIYSNILQCILHWDTMVNQESFCTETGITYLCNAPCYILPQLERKKNMNDVSMDHFTKTLSQMSLQSKLKRHTYKDDFPWNHIGNYYYTIKNKRTRNFLL